jgi:hypothetical protein
MAFESTFNKDNWHREAKTIAIRNAIRTRRWGMRVTVYDDPTPANNGDYVLTHNQVDDDRQNNANWLLVADIGETWGGGGGGASTPANEYFLGDGVEDEFTIADADGLIQLVEVGGQVMEPGDDYSIAGPVITFTAPPANGVSIGVYYWNDVTVVDQYFLGLFVSLAALQAAHPTASVGNYAWVDAGPGNPTLVYIWDVDDAQWQLSGSGGTVQSVTGTGVDNTDPANPVVGLPNGLPAVDTSGTAVAFAIPQIYGSEASPETGNITINTTGLVEGMVQLLIHNNGTAPTYGSPIKIITGEYVINDLNYIMLLAVSSTLVLATISQEL